MFLFIWARRMCYRKKNEAALSGDDLSATAVAIPEYFSDPVSTRFWVFSDPYYGLMVKRMLL